MDRQAADVANRVNVAVASVAQTITTAMCSRTDG